MWQCKGADLVHCALIGEHGEWPIPNRLCALYRGKCALEVLFKSDAHRKESAMDIHHRKKLTIGRKALANGVHHLNLQPLP